MDDLIVRRLLIDLGAPFDKHWNGGDPVTSTFLNALSMSFPAGEQFFIDAVRNAAKGLPVARGQEFEARLAGFIGQEATHRRLHALYNEQLLALGYRNEWENRIKARLPHFEGLDPRHALAVTAAYEHFTAIFAEHLLTHRSMLGQADPRLATLWFWHAAEESEHRAVASDLLRALEGNEQWRRRWMRIVTVHFVSDVLRQMFLMLRQDGLLWRWSTLKGLYRLFLGSEHGFVRKLYRPWRDYMREGFDPTSQGGEAGIRWLDENRSFYTELAPRHPSTALSSS